MVEELWSYISACEGTVESSGQSSSVEVIVVV